MVGPGEVDEELEPEVKEECEAKYGEIVKVSLVGILEFLSTITMYCYTRYLLA